MPGLGLFKQNNIIKNSHLKKTLIIKVITTLLVCNERAEHVMKTSDFNYVGSFFCPKHSACNC